MANNYEELVKSLRQSINWSTADGGIPVGLIYRLTQAADAIEELQAAVEREKTYTQFWEDAAKTRKAQYEELLHAAKKMHTWIFLNTVDEQKAYDECGLSDEMNAALGYSGQFEIKVNDDV